MEQLFEKLDRLRINELEKQTVFIQTSLRTWVFTNSIIHRQSLIIKTKQNFLERKQTKTGFTIQLKVPVNPIPAGGGVNLTPPPVVFLHNSKSIGLRLLKFSDFSYIPKALPLDLKPGFNTNYLSPQANCLNDCFFL